LATDARRLGAMFESDVTVRRILMERAFAHARLTGMSRAPIVEMLIRSTPDTSIAPKGAHVASLCCQHFPYKPPGSRNGHQVRARAARLNFSTVNSYAPNFRASDMGHSALSPMISEKPSRRRRLVPAVESDWLSDGARRQKVRLPHQRSRFGAAVAADPRRAPPALRY
jgi:hypothetical protein